MMRLAFFLVLSGALSMSAQKQGNNWYFGNLAGLSFNAGSPAALSNGQLGYTAAQAHSEGTSTISDSAGTLLFYSNGQSIWNRNHQLMMNGTGLLGNYSSTQSSVIVPAPGDSSRYFYIFTVSAGMCCNAQISDGLRYSKIDMCLDSLRGGVLPNEKNVKLVDTVAEKVAVCRHANGVDYWIVTHKFFSDKFVALQLTVSGITNTVVTQIGSLHGNNILQSMGQMKISPNRQRIALGSSNTGDILDLFDFNASNGVVSNWMALSKPNNNNMSVYGIEFSPDNSKLYARGLTSVGLISSMLWQYDLSAGGGNINAINSSMTVLDLDQAGLMLGAGLQLGPDDKIYTPSINNPNAVSVISNPNVAGVGCTYLDQALSLGTRTVSYTLPTVITNYDYSNGLIYPLSFVINSTSGNCYTPGSATVAIISGQTPLSYYWLPSGQTNAVATNLSAGIHNVTVVSSNGCVYNGTTSITVQNNLSGTITTLPGNCDVPASATASVITGSMPLSYNWLPSAQTSSTAINLSAGIHTVMVTSANGCSYTGTTTVVFQNNLSGMVSFTNPLCNGFNTGMASISLGSPGTYVYSWTGSAQTGSNVTGLVAGSYSVTATNPANLCLYTTTFQITQPPPLTFTALGDTACVGKPLQLYSDLVPGSGYAWSGPGSFSSSVHNPTLIATDQSLSGVYTVTITESNGCKTIAFANVQVDSLATVLMSANSPCALTSLSLSAGPAMSYQWSGPAGYSSTQQYPVINVATQEVAGVYTLSGIAANSCVYAGTLQVMVKNLPEGNLTAMQELCIPACTDLKFTTAPGTSVVSSFFQVNNEMLADTVTRYCFRTEGRYIVKTKFMDANGCVNSASLIVNAYISPLADFDFTPRYPLVGIDRVNFLNASTGMGQDGWTWFFIDNSTEPLQSEDASYLFETDGEHAVAMIVKNKWGCSDTAIKTVLVENDFSIYIPNAFTPNGDGLNDVFQPKGLGIKNYSLQILDRWGEPVFRSSDFLTAWDGSYRGSACKTDVYIWKITASGATGRAKEFQGHVTLYR